MDATLKVKWVEALRSGEYLQGTGKFERNGKFCCLGVLCIVGGAATVAPGIGTCGNWEFARNVLGDFDPHILATKNDNGASFLEISDYIEANIPATP